MNMASIFAEPKQLPHIPRVVQELMESFRGDEHSLDIDDISGKVAKDQSLTAKVLRLANSAHYGVPRTVATPQDAVMLLGFGTLRTMVLASGVTGAFSKIEGFDQNAFWKNAFSIAEVSKWIAGFTQGADKETAFTCGMMHSVGNLLIRMFYPTEAASIDQSESMGSSKRHQLENGQFGYNYADVGAELAKRWKFPDIIQDAIAHQNSPENSEDYSTEAGIIYIAKYLKRAHDENMSEDEIVAGFPLQVADKIGMDVNKAYSDLASLGELHSGLDCLIED
ncbi:HDOD domain-containing protein [Thalassolituus maritimus]|uniref:HDOD domain-containing protein n=1 Tax=Thalassolituus maritimus TaxID=484498 RepID=A0ABP9ZVC6_9GAMM